MTAMRQSTKSWSWVWWSAIYYQRGGYLMVELGLAYSSRAHSQSCDVVDWYGPIPDISGQDAVE